jgi:hypothetical protein
MYHVAVHVAAGCFPNRCVIFTQYITNNERNTWNVEFPCKWMDKNGSITWWPKVPI